MKHIQRLLEHKQLLLFLAVCWTIFMAILCLDSTADFPKIGIENIDKVAHLGLHFGFTTLWLLYFICKNKPQIIVKLTFLPFLMSLFFGITIEWAQQHFTTTRKADVFDVLSNTIGAGLAIISVIALQKRINL